VVVSLRYSISKEDLEARYQEKAQAAFKSQKFALSLVCYERLASMGLDRPENAYEMAIAQGSGAQGDPMKTLKIMSQLAPADQIGYARAHLYQAFHYMNNRGNLSQAQQRKLIETHLKHAIDAKI